MINHLVKSLFFYTVLLIISIFFMMCRNSSVVFAEKGYSQKQTNNIDECNIRFQTTTAARSGIGKVSSDFRKFSQFR